MKADSLPGADVKERKTGNLHGSLFCIFRLCFYCNNDSTP